MASRSDRSTARRRWRARCKPRPISTRRELNEGHRLPSWKRDGRVVSTSNTGRRQYHAPGTPIMMATRVIKRPIPENKATAKNWPLSDFSEEGAEELGIDTEMRAAFGITGSPIRKRSNPYPWRCLTCCDEGSTDCVEPTNMPPADGTGRHAGRCFLIESC